MTRAGPLGNEPPRGLLLVMYQPFNPLRDPHPLGVAEKEAAPLSLCIDIYDTSILPPFRLGTSPRKPPNRKHIGVNI